MKAVALATGALMFSAIGCAATTAQRPPTLTSVIVTPRVSQPIEEQPVAEADKHLDTYQRANELDRAGHCKEAKVAYAEYANEVAASNPRSAAMAIYYASLCKTHTVSDGTVDAVVSDIVRHRDREAVELTDQAVREGRASPWLEYYRAVAFADLGRTDDAVAAFARAEERFAGDGWAHAIAIDGRARALRDAARCADARRAYEEYASFVHDTDPTAAAAALEAASRCTSDFGRQRK